MKKIAISFSILVLAICHLIAGDTEQSSRNQRNQHDALDCSELRTGTFQTTESGLFLIFQRDSRYQTIYRIYPNKCKKDRILWLSDCMYKLTLIEDTDPEYGQTIGSVIFLRITHIGPDFYDAEYRVEGANSWHASNRAYFVSDINNAVRKQRLKNQ